LTESVGDTPPETAARTTHVHAPSWTRVGDDHLGDATRQGGVSRDLTSRRTSAVG
jgi:hypothetical protein